jgi:hypothetical protein
MKKQLLNFSVAIAAMVFIAGNSFAQLTAPIEKAECPAIDEATMKIDGYADESDWSAEMPITVRFSQPGDYGGDSDMSGSMKICWNYDGFYIFFDVKDDIAHNFDGTNGNNYQFDNVELFFNYDTSGVASSGLYAPDGIQMRFCRGLDDDNGQPAFGNSEAAKAEGYDVVPTKYVQIDNAGQWQVEAFIPWLYILASGTKAEDVMDSIAAHKDAFGFDVSMADSDGTEAGTGDRDCQYAWDMDGDGSGDEDNAWQNVQKFGILSLTGTPISSVKNVTDSKFEVYPNPVNNVLHFDNLNSVSEITIINALGQTVKVVDVTTNNVVLPVSDLAIGTYVAIIKSENETYTSKFVKK